MYCTRRSIFFTVPGVINIPRHRFRRCLQKFPMRMRRFNKRVYMYTWKCVDMWVNTYNVSLSLPPVSLPPSLPASLSPSLPPSLNLYLPPSLPPPLPPSCSRGRLYWVDSTQLKIMSSTMNGTDVRTVVSTGFSTLGECLS